MRILNSLLNKKLVFPLMFFLASSVVTFGGDKEKKNELTGYVGTYIFLSEPKTHSFLSFKIEYERKLSNRVSLAVSMGYVPLKWSELSDSASYDFYKRFGDSFDYNQVSKPGTELIFDFGAYIYFPLPNKHIDLFLYFGNSYYWMRESHIALDNEDLHTERITNSDSFYSFLDLGFGFRYRCNERYSMRTEWRWKNLRYLFAGEEITWDFLLGLSYRF